jgi:hypothetical protein
MRNLNCLSFLPACLLLGAAFPLLAHASPQAGTITQLEGTVKIFRHPGKKVQGPPPHALFEGETYSVADATVGMRVEQGNIVRTAPGAKARIVFDNGDQYVVGPGTAFRVFWNQDTVDGKPSVGMMYGKLRGVIEKGGPRTRLIIKTKSATMGVRGTDFFIADGGATGGTEIATIRGTVAVTPVAAPGAGEKPKTVEVTKGLSVDIAPPRRPEVPPAAVPSILPGPAQTGAPVAQASAIPAPVPAPIVQLRKTTQEEFTAIQRSTVIAPPKPTTLEPAPEVAKVVQSLETKATATLLKDIQNHDPELFTQLKEKPVASVQELDTKAVELLKKEAPKAPTKRKPFRAELEDLENGAYEKYFKEID